MDYQFGFTDVTTGLVADRVLFNSQTHMDAFFGFLLGFMKMMPEYRPHWVVDQIRAEATVLYPGCNYPAGPADMRPWDLSEPPLIIWNHRWEFDKSPETFFAALESVLSRGFEFRLALLGENFQVVPKPFLTAKEKFGERIVHYGYEVSKKKYQNWLKQGVIVVSTAIQENFGISIVEAIRHGCYPLLPNNLSYPELIPEKYHTDCLYNSQEELVEKLSTILATPGKYLETRGGLASHMEKYSWELVIDKYEKELENLVVY
jgi:glycosyltransferase involved in cell wall biosynthesis